MRIVKAIAVYVFIASIGYSAVRADTTYVSGVISTNTTWTLAGSPYIATSNLQIRSQSASSIAVLTVEAGVEIRMRAGVSIVLGDRGCNLGGPCYDYRGRLVALGTPSSRVRITADGATIPGSWGRIYHNQAISTDTLLYTDVEYGSGTMIQDGYWYLRGCRIHHSSGAAISAGVTGLIDCEITDNLGAGITVTSGSNPLIQNCQILRNGGNGYSGGSVKEVRNSTFADNSGWGLNTLEDSVCTGNSFTGNGGGGAYLGTSGPLPEISSNEFTGNAGIPLGFLCGGGFPMLSDNTFNGNSDEVIEMGGGLISQSSSVINAGLPYRFTADLTVKDGARAVLTVEAGVEIRMRPGVDLVFGDRWCPIGGGSCSYWYGRLVTLGTPTSRVKITADGAAVPGSWGRIYYNNGISDSDTLLYTDIEYGSGAMIQGGSWYLEGSRIRYSSGAGMSVAITGLLDCEITDNLGAGITVTSGNNSVIQNSQFLRNGGNGYSGGSVGEVRNSTFANNSGWGLNIGGDSVCTGNIFTANGGGGAYLGTSGALPLIANNQFTGNTGIPLGFLCGGSFPSLSDNTFGGNSDEVVEMGGGIVSLDSRVIDVGLPYRFTADLPIKSPTRAVLTVEAGVEIRMRPGADIIFGSRWCPIGGGSCSYTYGRLVTLGTPTSRVKITADGASVPGSWGRIYYDQVSDNDTLLYTDVEYGGGSGSGMIEGGNWYIQNCRIHHSATTGIASTSGTLSIRNSAIFGNAISGAVLYGGYVGSSEQWGCDLYDNGQYAIDYRGYSTLNAEYNYWGTTDSGTIANKIHGSVDYMPWAQASVFPLISVTPTSLAFEAFQQGGLPTSQTLEITNIGGGVLDWLASDDASWLNISPVSGTGNSSSITASVNTTDLEPDTYTAGITITSSDANNSHLTIPVQYVVSPPPTLAADPYGLGDQFWAFVQLSQEIQVRVEDKYQHTDIPGSMGTTVQIAFSNGEPALVLRDDGVGPDHTADDGIYSAIWLPQTLGELTLTFSATLSGYVSAQSVVSGGVYNPVDTRPLREAVSILKDNTVSYLNGAAALAYTVMHDGIDTLKTTRQAPALAFAESVSKDIITGATNTVSTYVANEFPKISYGTLYAPAVMAAKIIYEGEALKTSNQLQDILSTLENQTSLDIFDYYRKYTITDNGYTVDQAISRVSEGIDVPAYVPMGYPLGATAQRIRALAQALRDATYYGTDLSTLETRRDARLYWRWPGNCDQASNLFAIGSEISQARSFYGDLKALSNVKSCHKSASGICGHVGTVKTALNVAAAVTGGTTLPATLASVGLDLTCFAQEYFYSDMEYKLEIKLYDFLSNFGSGWPDQLGQAYELFGAVRSDLASSYRGDPNQLCSMAWRADNPHACVNFISGFPRLDGSIEVYNLDSRVGSASVAVELAVGDNTADLRTIRFDETPLYHFSPGEHKTIDYYINGMPGDFASRFSKYFVIIKVLAGGRLLDANILTIHRYVGYVTCSSGGRDATMNYAATDSTWIQSAGAVAPDSSRIDTIFALPGAVRATITASWVCDSVELHVYDAAQRHVGWNPQAGKIDSLIPGLTGCSYTSRVAEVKLSDLSAGPFRIVLSSRSKDTVNYSLSVYEESSHPAVLGHPDSLYVAAAQGDTSSLGILLAEQGGQQPVRNISISVSPLVHATDTIMASSLQPDTFPTTIAADSFLNIEAELPISSVQDTGLYLGTVSLTSDVGNYQIPVFLEVRRLLCCKGNTGNLDGDSGDVADISDLSATVDYLFAGGSISICPAENDVDKSGSVDIADLSMLVDYLFNGGALPNCP